MKAAPLATRAAFGVLGALAVFAGFAPAAFGADETVRACIAASTNGQTLRKQGRLLAARDELIACSRDACPAIVRSHCARWLSEVDATTPSVVVRAEDGAGADVIGARLSIDGHAGKLDGQPVRLDPGEHTVAIEDDHGARKEERFLLLEGEVSRRVTLRFAAGAPGHEAGATTATPPEPSRRVGHVPVGAWVLGAIGVAALGGATYFGLAANAQLNDLKSCSPHCPDSQTQTGRIDAEVFYVSLGLGAAAVAGAFVWALAFPSYAIAPASGRTGVAPSAITIDVRPVAGGAVTGLRFVY